LLIVEKIIVGRDKIDMESFGERGTAFIGKHIVGEGDDAHMTNPVFMDVIRPHVMLVTGKRGSGKSYSAFVLAEEIARQEAEIRNNLAVLFIDTMGIYWSSRSPNEKDREILNQWGLKPEGIDIRLFVPGGFVREYEDVGVRVDAPFTVSCSELTAQDWMLTFGFSPLDANGMAVERVIKGIKSRMKDYSIEDIISEIEGSQKLEAQVKNALTIRFSAAQDWGVFEKRGTPVREYFMRGRITVLDISHFPRSAGGWSVRSMVIGLLARKVFQDRLLARKSEEFEVMGGSSKENIPMVWIMIDEAHQFVPSDGDTAASEPLLTLVKEGREPGISLLLITQMPNKLNQDALAQSDIILSHRLTAEADIKALRSIMQTYMVEDIQDYLNGLPRQTGTAIIMDDNSERIFPIQVRPRLSWHAGGSPSAIKKRGILDL
jgi:DNA helicase HerA-like ATPase